MNAPPASILSNLLYINHCCKYYYVQRMWYSPNTIKKSIRLRYKLRPYCIFIHPVHFLTRLLGELYRKLCQVTTGVQLTPFMQNIDQGVAFLLISSIDCDSYSHFIKSAQICIPKKIFKKALTARVRKPNTQSTWWLACKCQMYGGE